MKTTIFPATSITTAVNSGSIKMDRVDTAAVQINITGESSPVATVALEASNDNTNWIEVADSSTAITTGAEIMLNVADIGYGYLRVAFGYTSGTLTAEAIVTGKERRV